MNVTNKEETIEISVGALHVSGEECRICLKKCSQVWELFHHTGEDISRKLMAFAAVQVEEGDGLPQVICQNCRSLLDVSYDFKCQVEKSDAKLREFLILKESTEETVKIMTLTHSVNAAITEAIADEIAQEHCGNNVGECAELARALVNPSTAHIVTELSEHHFNTDHGTIIFEIQPPSEQNGSVLDQAIDVGTEECNVIDVKTIDTTICQDTGDQVESVSMERFRGLRETNMETESFKQEMMVTDETDESDYDNTEAPIDNLIKIEDIEEKSTLVDNNHIEENIKEEIYESVISDNNLQDDIKQVVCESDEEEKPLISRTQRQKCPHCIKTFASKPALQRHIAVHKHKTKLRYVCYVCDKQFANVSKLKSHVIGSHDGSSNEDKTGLEENAMDTVRMEKQVTRSDGKKNLKYSCKMCGKQFTYQKSFMTHAKSHPGYEPEPSNEKEERVGGSDDSNERGNESEDDDMPLEGLQCTQCGKLFATKRNLKRHISTHSGLKFHCSTCGKEFSRVDKLKEHEQSKHKEELFAQSSSDSDDDTDNENKQNDGSESRKKEKNTRPHQCPMCIKAFAQEQSLANHMERHKRVKDTQKRFLCEVCSKCFAQSGSLVAHMRTHTGVKPYVCNVCSRAFTKSTYLQLHLRTHSGEKPYICQYCSRAFARANTLARHITMHTGEAKYHCQICMKSFRRLTSLNEHTYTHTGQRPYACKICTKRYNNAGSLYAHTKKCKAQQLSGATTTYTTVPDEDAINQNGSSVPPMMMYSQRKLVEETTVGQITPSSQYIIPNVHNQKTLTSNVIPPFAVEDPNYCTVNTKPYKNSYYTMYPNM